MSNVDMMVAEISGQKVIVGDFFSTDFTLPKRDTSQDIYLMN